MATSPVPTPTLQDILSLLKAIQAVPTGPAVGSPTNALTGGFDPNSPGGLAAVQNYNAQQLGIAQQALQAGRGKTFNDLPYDVKALINSANAIKSQTGPVHRGLFGSIVHDVEGVSGSLLGRVSDVLSRGQYVSADIAKQVENQVANTIRHPDTGNILKDAGLLIPGGAIAEHPEATWQGLSGKVKGSYADVIQHGADLLKEHENVALANAHPGIAHVNPFLKGGLGLAGDIFLDPTTYLGSGLVGKVLQSPEKLEDLAKTQQLAKDTERLGVSAKDTTGVDMPLSNTEMAHTLGLDAPYKIRPGQKLVLPRSQFLRPQQYAAKIKDAEGPIKDYADKASKDAFAQKTAEYDKMTPLPESPTTAQIARHDYYAKKYAIKELGKTQNALRDEMASEMLRLTKENLAPGMTRGLGVTFGGKRIATVPLERLAGAIDTAKAGDGAIGKSLNNFDRVMRNSAGVHRDLNAVKLNHGVGARVRALNFLKNKAFEGVSHEDRVRALRNWAEKITENNPILNSKGENINDYIGSRLEDIQRSAAPDVGDLDSPNEINRYLPRRFKVPGGIRSGKNFDPEWLRNHVIELLKKEGKHADIHDPAFLLGHLNVAHEKAMARKAMAQEIARNFGHDIKMPVTVGGNKMPLDNTVTRDLIKNHGYRTVSAIKPNTLDEKIPIRYIGKGTVFDPETAKGIERLFRHVDGPATNGSQLERWYDQVLQEWKTLVTRYNPGYHERNLFGETFYSFLAGVTNPAVYASARKVLAGRGHAYLGSEDVAKFGTDDVREIRARNALQNDPVKMAFNKQGESDVAFRRTIKTAHGSSVQNVSPDLAWHLYEKFGLKTGFLTEDLTKAVESNASKVGIILHHMNSKVQTFTENIEDFARMGHFIDAIKKSPYTDINEAAAHAAEEVKKYHFDYSDFTQSEKKIFVRAFPFYKWTRKNIPLMMEMTLAKPGKVIMPLKVQNAVSEMLGYNRGNNTSTPGDYIVPSWLSHDVATPVGNLGGPNTTYIDPPLPWQQAFEALQGPKQTAGQMANPLAQLISEVFTHKTLTNQDAQGSKTFANQSPMTSFIYNMVTANKQGRSNNTTLAQFLTGLGLFENTPNRMKAQAKQEQQQAVSQRKKYEHQQGTTRTTNHPGLR